ncbi:glycosyltransferase [Micromonospora sp. DT81.3]|uniref:glycosyltransferase n=1 Tax=Micromonospora sp. DT81.3 TaxID=3416523 RepID=UPI003CFB64E2
MSATRLSSAAALRVLDQRVFEAARFILPDPPISPSTEVGLDTATLLGRMLKIASARSSRSIPWLILTAVTGRFPSVDDVRAVQRTIQLEPLDAVETALLGRAVRFASESRIDLPMRVVTTPLIDVDTSGRLDYQSGIHRVVRETVSRWAGAHEIELGIWDDTYRIFRSAAPREVARVVRFGATVTPDEVDPGYEPELLVPWNTVVVLPDVPIGMPTEALAGIAHCSGNRLSAVGYDLIPITSVETRPIHDAMAAGEWLVPLKAADRIAGISTSATAEFSGFAQMLEAQGLTGPLVREVRLPASTAPTWLGVRNRARRDKPRIVFSGTREPHKNHRALLFAAERLWTEGLSFEVRMVGGNGWTDEHVRETIERLTADGRSLVDLGRVSEEVLWSELADADAVAFVSLHEGYGLPLVEALAVGTPVLTTSYGSQAEIAADGGCITVDPRDDLSIVQGLRQLVTDADFRDALVREARDRPDTTWDYYAAELWDFLVAPLLEEASHETS